MLVDAHALLTNPKVAPAMVEQMHAISVDLQAGNHTHALEKYNKLASSSSVADVRPRCASAPIELLQNGNVLTALKSLINCVKLAGRA